MRIGVDARPLQEKQTSGIPMYVRRSVESASRCWTIRTNICLYCHQDFNYELPGPNFSKRSGALTRLRQRVAAGRTSVSGSSVTASIFLGGTQHILPLRHVL